MALCYFLVIQAWELTRVFLFLLKVAGHLLSDIIPPEAVELMVGALFVNPGVHAPPASLAAGLLRFLLLLGNHNWLVDPLVVDTTMGEMTLADQIRVAQHFRDHRASLPPMSLLSRDDLASVWTAAAPTAPLLVRAVSLAQAAARAVESQLKEAMTAKGDVADIDDRLPFRHSFGDYSAVIHLKSSCLPYASCAVDPPAAPADDAVVFRNLAPKSHSGPVEFDPVELFLDALRVRFGNSALFFCDPYGGARVGVVWKPTVRRIFFFLLTRLMKKNCCLTRHYRKTTK